MANLQRVLTLSSGPRPAYTDQATPKAAQLPGYPRDTSRDPPQLIVSFCLRLLILGRRVSYSHSRRCASLAQDLSRLL